VVKISSAYHNGHKYAWNTRSVNKQFNFLVYGNTFSRGNMQTYGARVSQYDAVQGTSYATIITIMESWSYKKFVIRFGFYGLHVLSNEIHCQLTGVYVDGIMRMQ
jgi:hypothetical protein